jgi:hypothetical protein
VKVGTVLTKAFTTPIYIDTATAGEDIADTIVRII